ncbi:glycerol dehydrogenase [Deltaproteobacteria bacterium Smac51]|nr:glycerol dehydrogenase [Deltaproteobacteria bacterium Smac51]
MTSSRSRAFGGPFRYVQGPGELTNLAQHAADYGDRLFLLVDGFLMDSIRARFNDESAAMTWEKFSGECTEAEVGRVAALASEAKAQVIVGVGGGKTLDAAKLAAANLSLPLIIAPTSASTDAPTSAMSVLYKETGEHVRAVCLKHSAELVLVDSSIIAAAPLRLLVAGMGDALSTWFEARANAASDTANYIGRGYRRSLAAMAIAEKCYRTLLADGFTARLALENGAVTEAVENVIEANILLSGLGFENTGCAGAHAVHTGFHEIESAAGAYHGEIVAFGVLFQLMLENAPAVEVEEVLQFMYQVGLPMTMTDLNVEPTEENFQKIAGRILDGNSGVEAEPFLVTRDLVLGALKTADAMGRRFKSRAAKV